MCPENKYDPFHSLVSLLKEKGLTIASAESCTAGLFSACIASCPGASAVFQYGFVVYSIEAKIKMLGVDPQTIDRFGVVSPETAGEMAKRAAARADAQVGFGVTGFAGPTSDGVLPVGRVCFGYQINGNLCTECVDFGNPGRNEVRRLAAFHGAEKLLAILEATA